MPAADEEDEASRPGRSFNFKVVVFGSKGSGKTSLVKRFARSAFDQG